MVFEPEVLQVCGLSGILMPRGSTIAITTKRAREEVRVFARLTTKIRGRKAVNVLMWSLGSTIQDMGL